jgi:hypothetical protein
MHHNVRANVNVLRSHWGRGISRQPAAAIDAWAREQRVRRLTGLVLLHNTRALRFAAAAGFRKEPLSPRYTIIDGRSADRVRVVNFLQGENGARFLHADPVHAAHQPAAVEQGTARGTVRLSGTFPHSLLRHDPGYTTLSASSRIGE